MYAIFEDGSHQYRAKEGDSFEIQRHELAEGQSTVEFDRVLMIGDGADSRVGRPYIAGAKVVAEIVGEVKGEKIDIIKFRRRKRYRRKAGHRQLYLRVTVQSIQS
ncbi:MAG: 50S ribosomal protein L21 [Phycisphaerales bacterium]|nr:50S ribosomal protein L21 [Phycisphaerales bacterium]